MEFIHNRFHLGVYAGVAGQVSRKPIGKLDDEAGWRTRLKTPIVD